MWSRIKTIADYKGKRHNVGEVTVCLSEDLNTFYYHFEKHSKPKFFVTGQVSFSALSGRHV